MNNLYDEINRLLDDDLARFNEDGGRRARDTRQSRDRYVRYLVSVVTHPIGLRASINPFNSSQEHMLAYIMEMFNMSDRRIKKLFGEDMIRNKSNVTVEQKSQGVKQSKTHSWRPELRVRLNAPKFFYNEKVYLTNLSVRVYLFGEKTHHKNKTANKQKGGIVNNMFRRLNLDYSTLIRPVNEMRRLVRFVPEGEREPDGKSSNYRMVQVIDEENQVNDDLHLKIRRYYCDPSTVHILRLEFWSDSENTKMSLIKGYKNFLRRLVYNGCKRGCCCVKRKSVYMNEKQEFYGYINIRLSQLPAYPLKQSYQILSIHGRKVNNCEVNLELRNRMLTDEHQDTPVASETTIPKAKQSADKFMVNHLRLYANCLLYQCQALKPTRIEGLTDVQGEISQNIAIDNLLYIPAYALINQHRLQSNLNLLEDQCVRRISMMLLLIKLEENSKYSKSNQIKALLVSVLQNEYMIAQSSFDDKTMQENDPFHDSIREVLVKLEFVTMKEFIYQVLAKRLKSWLPAEISSAPANDRIITLYSLRLFKTAVNNFEGSFRGEMLKNFRGDSSTLKNVVEQVLCDITISHLSKRITALLQKEKDPDESRSDNHRYNTKYNVLHAIDENNVWLQLLKEMNQINHDLKLYWTPDGFDGLMKSQQIFVSNLNMLGKLERGDFRKIIEAKIDNYLR